MRRLGDFVEMYSCTGPTLSNVLSQMAVQSKVVEADEDGYTLTVTVEYENENLWRGFLYVGDSSKTN